jgi:hypothetical protein
MPPFFRVGQPWSTLFEVKKIMFADWWIVRQVIAKFLIGVMSLRRGPGSDKHRQIPPVKIPSFGGDKLQLQLPNETAMDEKKWLETFFKT